MNESNCEFTATMLLPKDGKQYWTDLMQGKTPVADSITVGSPIVLGTALFDDGTIVVGGVSKTKDPTDYNIVFMWVYDQDGTKYPGWPIDLSDSEDFFINSIAFSPSSGDDADHLLLIKDSK